MDILRKGFDGFYNVIKPVVFGLTRKNPKVAHRIFSKSLKLMRELDLSDLVLDNSANYIDKNFVLSNAAGFAKDGEFHPLDLKLLGFDRAVYGTITGDPWEGNSGQTIWRFPKTFSAVNREGLPGIGCEAFASVAKNFGYHDVPITINLMSTPGKSNEEILKDLKKTVFATRRIRCVDRYELNPSCPNTFNTCGNIDARKENISRLSDMIGTVRDSSFYWQEVYVKVSPDSNDNECDNIIEAGKHVDINGYVVTNTTRRHDINYIPMVFSEGGGSGDAVYYLSLKKQKYFADRVGDKKLIACGGIRSIDKLKERLEIGNCNEAQIFTPLIFEGTGLLRKLRKCR
jgi:dihydroorotate dehydrogenase